ncbi:hypothetical protein V8F33_013733 [Rhypophila sp. PSN 637]
MNSLSILLIVSASISLGTALIGPLNALIKAVTTIPRRIELLKDEIKTMGEILGECLTTIEEAPTKAPPHVQDLGVATYEQWKDVGELAERAWDATAPNSKSAFMSAFWRIRAARYINKREGELVSAVANLRDKVGLLRDACSEIRVRSQLVEISATMTRLAEISVSSKRVPEPAPQNQTYPGISLSSTTLSEKQQHQDQVHGVVQNTFQQDVASWQADEYIFNGVVQVDLDNNASTTALGMVALEDATKTGGQRFTYSPARIKIDTSPAADFVSFEYLQRAGFNLANLQDIPESEQRQIEGLDRLLYTPRHIVTLQWYRQGEQHMNTTKFFVVGGNKNGPPFDLVLSTRGFAEEAERRLFSSSLLRARKTQGKNIRHDLVPSALLPANRGGPIRTNRSRLPSGQEETRFCQTDWRQCREQKQSASRRSHIHNAHDTALCTRRWPIQI